MSNSHKDADPTKKYKDMNVKKYIDVLSNNLVNPKIGPLLAKLSMSYLQEWRHAQLRPRFPKLKYDEETVFGRILLGHRYINWIDRNTNVNACTVFSMTKNGKTINYGYVYSKQHHIKLDYTSFCIGPNFLSADGEYRPHWSLYEVFIAREARYADLIREVEDYLINKPRIQLNVHHHIDNEEMKELMNSHIEKDRMSIRMYVAAWIYQSYMRVKKTQPSTIDPRYNEVMFDKSDTRFFAHIMNKYNIEEYQKETTKFGQKIMSIPITDKYGSPMRELKITTKLTNLMINGICGGFPFIHDWTIIQNISKNIYNNPRAVLREEISDKAKIERPDEQDFILSNTGMCMTSEYAGMTIADELASMSVSDFQKYLFEITYAGLCMHMHGVIHGDLHLFNATINRIYDHQMDHVFILDKTYTFRSTGWIGTIIDFGRSILQDDKEVASRSKAILGRSMPFKQASAMDMFVHCTRLMDHPHTPDKKLTQQILDTLAGINKKETRWPNKVIIDTCFSEYVKMGDKIGMIYVLDNKIKWTWSDFPDVYTKPYFKKPGFDEVAISPRINNVTDLIFSRINASRRRKERTMRLLRKQDRKSHLHTAG